MMQNNNKRKQKHRPNGQQRGNRIKEPKKMNKAKVRPDDYYEDVLLNFSSSPVATMNEADFPEQTPD